MATQSVHDAVKQPESADAPSPADVPELKTTDPAVRAAPTAQIDSTESATAASAEPGSTHLAYNEEVVKSVNAEAYEHNKGVSDASEGGGNAPTSIESAETVTVNGDLDTVELREIDVAENASTRSAGIDGSHGSDTDYTKNEGVGSTEKDAVPRHSVKKSATFKPVSVTKNLLAKTGTVATPTKPNSDKPPLASGAPTGTTAQPVARPRLVAKTASGPRSSTPKLSGMAAKNGRESGPDPNQVWNRNRVATAPQATPKHLTDEELRQQYGIQLASRPREDEDSKEAKWADIDDDEDDWAPETIEWNDGTKIDLSQVAPSPGVSQASEEPVKRGEPKLEAPVATLPVQKPTTVGPNATVLKLGSGTQTRTNTNAAPKPSDKPMLVSRPPAPAAVKSPWAPLPAVDKVPPVAINPPMEQPPARFGQRNMHGFDAMPPAPALQAKEIAADDFSRMPRDGQQSGPRELYNSQSGRYEPVNDARRQTVRKDGGYRQPSVLQRPSQTDTHAPAEPSPAFQSSTFSSRRRGSSIASHGSGHLAQPLLGKGPDSRGLDQHTGRRESLQGSAPSSTDRRPSHSDASPVVSHGEPITPLYATWPQSPYIASNGPFGHQQHAPGGMQEPGTATVSNQDAVTLQKQLMREKREAAIKRRKEEEKREEAERKERIRLRMEKMGMPPKPDEKAGENGVENKVEAAKAAPSAPAKDLKDIREKEAQPHMQSPPKPPAPSATGQPQQYGLMKLHGPQPPTSVAANEAAPHKQAVATSPVDKKSELRTDKPTPKPNGEAVSTKPMARADAGIEAFQKTVSDARPLWANIQPSQAQQQHQHQQTPQNGFPGWNNNSTATRTSPSTTLWGPPPSNHKALGNGDFNKNIHSQLRPSPQQPFSQHLIAPQPPPQPIGTPRQPQQQQQERPASTPFRSPDISSRALAEDSQTIPAFPPETAAQQAPRQQPLYPPVAYQPRPAPSQANANTMAQVQPPSEAPKTGIAAWHNFAATAGQDDAERFARAKRELNARLAEQSRSGHQPVFRETFKKVTSTAGSLDSRRVVDSTETDHKRGYPSLEAQRGAQPPPTQPPTQLPTQPPTQPPTQQVRSRYQDIFDQSRDVSMPLTPKRPGSPSPPPPDSISHPAYVGPMQKPLVNLPGSRGSDEDRPAKPVVRLPPAQDPVASKPVNEETPQVSLESGGAVPQPLGSDPSWRDRINGLFGRKPSPEKKQTHLTAAPVSSSKVPLELSRASPSAGTPVTLPPKRNVSATLAVPSFEDVEALFEEPKEMGSTPPVRMPTMGPGVWPGAKVPFVNHRRARMMELKERDVVSMDPFVLRDALRTDTRHVTVYLRGMASPATCALKMRPSSSGQAGPSRRSGHHHGGSVRGRGRGQKREGAGGVNAHANAGGQGQQGNGAPQALAGAAPVQTSGGPKSRPKSRNASGGNGGQGAWGRKASGVTV